MDDVNRQSPVNWPGLVLKSTALLVFAALVAFVVDYKLKLGRVPSVIMALSIFGVGLFSMLKLRGAPREMGFTFGLKFFSVTVFFSVVFCVMLCRPKDKAACLVLKAVSSTQAATGSLAAFSTSTKPAPMAEIGANTACGWALGKLYTSGFAAFMMVALISCAVRFGST